MQPQRAVVHRGRKWGRASKSRSHMHIHTHPRPSTGRMLPRSVVDIRPSDTGAATTLAGVLMGSHRTEAQAALLGANDSHAQFSSSSSHHALGCPALGLNTGDRGVVNLNANGRGKPRASSVAQTARDLPHQVGTYL